MNYELRGNPLTGSKCACICSQGKSYIFQGCSLCRHPQKDVGTKGSQCMTLSSVAQSCLTFAAPWTAACQASLSITSSQSLLKLMYIEPVMPSNHLILCCLLLLPPSIFRSIRVFSNESLLCIRWLKYWRFSCSISLSNEYSGLISFRMDWLDLLAVQETLKRIFSNTTVQKHQFFGVQLYSPTLTSWTFVGKVMTLKMCTNVRYTFVSQDWLAESKIQREYLTFRSFPF